MNVIKAAISLLLYALCKAEVLVGRHELEESEVLNVFQFCQGFLLDYIKHHKVIGGIFFGYTYRNETDLLYGSDELKVWIIYTYILFILKKAICISRKSFLQNIIIKLIGWNSFCNFTTLRYFRPTIEYWLGCSFIVMVCLVYYVQVWRSILSLEVPDNKKVVENWNACVAKVIKERVTRVIYM